MLPKAHKMTTGDYRQIRSEKGLFVYFDHFSVKVLENKDKTTRFGVVVSTKIAKNAVTRNKIRRRLYSIIEKYQKSLVKQGYFIIFTAKSSILETSFKDLEQDVQKSLVKLGFL